MDFGFVGEKVREISREAAENGGCDFVHFEIAGTKRSPVLRVYIDKADGLSVENCADVSREIEARLDVEDIIPTKYVLEVSSPGLERELYSMDDFRRFVGKLAKVRTNVEIDGSKTIVGRIDGIEESNIRFELRNGKTAMIPYSSVSKANLKVDLDAEFRKR